NRAALMHHLRQVPTKGLSSLDRDVLDQATARLAGIMDPVNGGPRGAPKFPNAPLLELLWRGGGRRNDPALTRPMLTTLERICAGGIRDHVGGGFARYAVDERWLVPHFEKMLYDNAQILALLALAHATTRSAVFAEAAEELVEWLE